MSTDFKRIDLGRYKVTGNLTFSTTEIVWEAAKKFLPALEQDEIQIDISEVSEIDSGGVALLVAWARWAHCNNKSLDFLNATDKTRKLVEINKLQNVLRFKQEVCSSEVSLYQ